MIQIISRSLRFENLTIIILNTTQYSLLFLYVYICCLFCYCCTSQCLYGRFLSLCNWNYVNFGIGNIKSYIYYRVSYLNIQNSSFSYGVARVRLYSFTNIIMLRSKLNHNRITRYPTTVYNNSY